MTTKHDYDLGMAISMVHTTLEEIRVGIDESNERADKLIGALERIADTIGLLVDAQR